MAVVVVPLADWNWPLSIPIGAAVYGAVLAAIGGFDGTTALSGGGCAAPQVRFVSRSAGRDKFARISVTFTRPPRLLS